MTGSSREQRPGLCGGGEGQQGQLVTLEEKRGGVMVRVFWMHLI